MAQEKAVHHCLLAWTIPWFHWGPRGLRPPPFLWYMGILCRKWQNIAEGLSYNSESFGFGTYISLLTSKDFYFLRPPPLAGKVCKDKYVQGATVTVENHGGPWVSRSRTNGGCGSRCGMCCPSSVMWAFPSPPVTFCRISPSPAPATPGQLWKERGSSPIHPPSTPLRPACSAFWACLSHFWGKVTPDRITVLFQTQLSLRLEICKSRF